MTMLGQPLQQQGGPVDGERSLGRAGPCLPPQIQAIRESRRRMGSHDVKAEGDEHGNPSQESPLSDLTRYWLRAQPPVAAYVSAAVWNSHDAEDIVQQVAEVCAIKFQEFDPSRSFLSWALGIARNEVLRYYRRRRNVGAELTEESLQIVADELAGRELLLEDRFEALKECLTGVVGRTKQMLEMRYYRDMKADEIANRLGLSSGAVRVALCRVRQELADCIRHRLRQQEQPRA